jgi:RimJ/RimL family protein N-acetyltransferase
MLKDIPEFSEPEGLEIRYTIPEDETHLMKWFKEQSVLRWFPMQYENEILDSVKRWISFYRWKCSLTATLDGVPCGIVTLWIQPYRKIAHQCQFGILVSEEFRGLGIGSALLKNIMNLAKSNFKVELVHLEVYDENPAYSLYERFGFKKFGYQERWIKEADGKYRGRTFMERLI